MIYKMTFTNGKDQSGGIITVSSRIPLTEFNRITQIKSSAETIVALLNEMEDSHSWRQKNSLVWSICQHCQTIFLSYRKDRSVYCSRECNGYYRGEAWKNHAHKGRASWSKETEESYRLSQMGENNPAWKGGLTYFKRKGKYADQAIKYVRCPQEYMQMARKDGYVMEHRLKVAQVLGRPLLRSEVVHHINHDATDNRLENLMLFASNADHKRHEHGQAIEPLWQPSHLSNTPE